MLEYIGAGIIVRIGDVIEDEHRLVESVWERMAIPSGHECEKCPFTWIHDIKHLLDIEMHKKHLEHCHIFVPDMIIPIYIRFLNHFYRPMDNFINKDRVTLELYTESPFSLTFPYYFILLSEAHFVLCVAELQTNKQGDYIFFRVYDSFHKDLSPTFKTIKKERKQYDPKAINRVFDYTDLFGKVSVKMNMEEDYQWQAFPSYKADQVKNLDFDHLAILSKTPKSFNGYFCGAFFMCVA